MLGVGPGDLKPHPLLMDCVVTVLTELTLQLLALHTALTLEEIFLQPPKAFPASPILVPRGCTGRALQWAIFRFQCLQIKIQWQVWS